MKYQDGYKKISGRFKCIKIRILERLVWRLREEDT